LKASKGIELRDTGEIDKILFGHEKLQTIQNWVQEKEKAVYEEIDEMIAYAENVLNVLESYQDGLNGIQMMYNMRV
jgi:hypothetical protein